MPTAHVNAIGLYYEIQGEGPPVLLIPGLGVDVNYFADIIRDLAASCRVVAFDPRGAGQSEKPDVPYSIDDMADDAVGLLQFLGLDKVTVVGTSMGGRTALMLALDHSDLVERLVLVATSARVPPVRRFTRRWLIMDVLSRLPRPKSADAQPRFAWERQRDASIGFDCTERLDEIKVPTLVVHGTTDHIVPFPLGKDMADGISDARLVSVPGGHRALFIGQGHRLAEEIERFIAET
jgi:pimeloyl-ACP methyl ester carboxylesterase